MNLYHLSLEGDILRVGFGEPASSDAIVKEVSEACQTLKTEIMGRHLKINGPATLSVAMVLAHEFGHICKSISFFDPKLRRYVVSISHDKDLRVGDLID